MAAVRAHLQDERQIHRHAMLHVITPAAVARLQPAPRSAVASPPVGAPRRRAAQRAPRGPRSGRSAPRAEVPPSTGAGGIYSPNGCTRCAIAAKKLRYALEMERELTEVARDGADQPPEGACRTRSARFTIYEILLARTREVQTALAASNRPLSAELGMLVRTLEEDCRDGHATYIHVATRWWNSATRIITAARRRPPNVYDVTPWPPFSSCISFATPLPPSAARSIPTTGYGR